MSLNNIDTPLLLPLLDQIIEIAKSQEEILKTLYIQTHQASKAVGDGSLIFHLHKLRELLVSLGKDDPVVLDGETLNVSYGKSCCRFAEELNSGKETILV